MPSMVVRARCESCGDVQKFMEFKAEPCGPNSPFERRYGFRCLKCKSLVDELVDDRGTKHAWADGKHVEAERAA